MFFPSAEQLNAAKELINSRGFMIASCFALIAGLIFYIVHPIPEKLDLILAAVKQGCDHYQISSSH